MLRVLRAELLKLRRAKTVVWTVVVVAFFASMSAWGAETWAPDAPVTWVGTLTSGTVWLAGWWGVLVFSLAAAQDSDNLRGEASLRITSPIAPTLEVTAYEDDDEPVPEILHVDALASGDRTGASWADAHVSLQDALALARAVSTVREIQVARGTYRPAGPSGNRGMTFLLVPGLAVRGGYAGSLHPEPGLRDIRSFETICRMLSTAPTRFS